MPNLESASGLWVGRSFFFAGLPAVAVVVTLAGNLAGCGSPSTAPPTRLGSLAIEPELTSAAAPERPRRDGRVPEVIARPKPFRWGDFAASEPARPLPATISPRIAPAERRGQVRQVVALESGPALEPAALPAAPHIAEIRDMFTGYRRAFNRHDAAAAAAHWSVAADNLNLDTGEVTRGRDAVRNVFAALFEIDAEATLDIDVDAIRPVGDAVAVVDGIARVSYADGAVAASRFSAVVSREDDQWRLASVRETATAPEPRAARPLDGLAWLVGSWEDVGEGVIASSQASWSTERGFLVRTHVAMPDDEPAARPAAGDTGIPGLLPAAAGRRREITEIIGWDPERELIRCWIFSADGRFAEGTWSRAADGWTVRIEGQGLDAGRTANCTLVPDGDAGLIFRCEGEGLEGLLPPPCGYTRTAR